MKGIRVLLGHIQIYLSLKYFLLMSLEWLFRLNLQQKHLSWGNQTKSGHGNDPQSLLSRCSGGLSCLTPPRNLKRLIWLIAKCDLIREASESYKWFSFRKGKSPPQLSPARAPPGQLFSPNPRGAPWYQPCVIDQPCLIARFYQPNQPPCQRGRSQQKAQSPAHFLPKPPMPSKSSLLRLALCFSCHLCPT